MRTSSSRGACSPSRHRQSRRHDPIDLCQLLLGEPSVAWLGTLILEAQKSFGGGAFDVPPSELLQGSTDCALTLSVVGVAIAFFRNGKLVGSFFGGGPNIGAGHAAGSGEWKRV